jgi:peroxiredoxin
MNSVPNVTFRTRVEDSMGFSWKDVTTADLFANLRVVVFSLPGAFTPTCSTYQLPDFEKLYGEFAAEGIDRIYCVTVNDAFVCNAWAHEQGLEHVEVIPDGSGKFTRMMGMLVDKDNLGFGMRSWRYAMLVDDGDIVEQWVEPGVMDNAEDDPYGETSPQVILERVKKLSGNTKSVIGSAISA